METLRNILTRLEREGAALGHFNVAELAALKAVIAAAGENKVPVFIGVSEGERDFFGTREFAAMVKSMREESSLPVFINADHTHSLSKAIEAADAGFDAVVIDFSKLPFEQNVARTKEAVEAIKSINPAILAEGEIGYIGSGSEIHEAAEAGARNLTTPEEARQFVEATRIDILAPAVGNMHGMLESMVKGTAKKRLDIQRIAQIKSAAGVFLTLHGGSGTDDEDFQQAIAAGINIIHINTELRVAWRQSLERSLAADPNQVVPYGILQPVVQSVKQVAANRLRLFNMPRKAVLESATRKFLDELKAVNAPPLSQVTLEEARASHARGQDVPVVKLPADIEDRTIGVGPSGKLLIRIVRPKGLVGPLPAVMYFHGGGFVLGDRHDWDRLLRDLAYAANASIVFVEYSRSPEARYPVAIEEAYSATRWVAENGDEINVDRTRLALAGDGSGGNMVAAVTLLAKQRGGPKLDLQVMFYPNTDAGFSSDSYKQFASEYFLSRQDMEWFLDQYLPDKTRRTEATATPLNASIEQLTGLPPALLITAECDVLRDEGEAYARKLLEAGVTVTSTRYLGTIHGFVTLNRLAYTPAARMAIMQAGAALQNALEGGGTRAAA